MILESMLQRLYASLVHGPCINCKPHGSRQRLDFVTLGKLGSGVPSTALHKLLAGENAEFKASTRNFVPPTGRELTDEERKKKATWEEQHKLLTKLLGIIEDAVDYEQETGENALYVGFPLLCLPATQTPEMEVTSKVIAPIAFLPVELVLKKGTVQSLVIKPKGEGTDFLVPNPALLAWVEQQTKQDTSELFADPEANKPYREINEVIEFLIKALQLELPPLAVPEKELPVGGEPGNTRAPVSPATLLVGAPKSDEIRDKPFIAMAGVLGLFPLSNQGLLRDTQAMIEEGNLAGPILPFLSADVLDAPPPDTTLPKALSGKRDFAAETLTTPADPCQSRAVKLARECPNLVIHGPPGTGKSQTITNIISDHLGNGERILFVCDKRTALDVVKNRLDHIGLGHLCAVVHDPQRDQRDLYMGIRAHLDALADQPKLPSREKDLEKMNTELQSLHDELLRYYGSLMGREKGDSFHDLVGRWEEIQIDFPEDWPRESFLTLELSALRHAEPSVKESLTRGDKVRFHENPWSGAIGIQLKEFLSEPLTQYTARFTKLGKVAEETDETAVDDLPALGPGPLAGQAVAYDELTGQIGMLEQKTDPSQRHVWANSSVQKLKTAHAEIQNLLAYQPVLEQSLDPELKLIAEAQSIENVNKGLATLKDYEAISPAWLRIFPTAKVKEAKALLKTYGMQATPENVKRLENFFMSFKGRLVVSSFYAQQVEEAAHKGPVADDKLKSLFEAHAKVIEFLLFLEAQAQVSNDLKKRITGAMRNKETIAGFEGICQKLAVRARALEKLEAEVHSSNLFRPEWIEQASVKLREGGRFGGLVRALADSSDTMEDSIRLRDVLTSMPDGVYQALYEVLNRTVGPENGWSMLLKQALANEISSRIRTDENLQAVDAERLEKLFREYAHKEEQKRDLVRDGIVAFWQEKQVSRLLAGTGTQLNSNGAKLKQRFFVRGERALKLRQMINHGRDIPGGDPLFDLCPVWMASPGTVAQIFPREAIFDVLVFDEASQCRLEEALPVLLRGKRVVIAGDPKQLPPTRFFESAVKESEDEEIESDQDLFERQQRSVEDLLTAALNLDVHQAYLDVHYRSRNSDLIGFSNENFYGARLQPIPGHPSHRAKEAPIKFLRVDGIYQERANRKEAEEVVRIVKELLSFPTVPSIGIACFNLVQRDLILEVLDDAASEDRDFADKLEVARKRRGAGSFEGLFVKNLENVQGDERDHMIISTTFGPDSNGKFRRVFGPVGTALGGRRLNVLVTRAREAIHLITSIPRSEYQTLPEVSPDATPTGRWYLYAYLKFAESLQQQYQQTGEQVPKAGKVQEHGSESKSVLTKALASRCASQHGLSSGLNWGNEGFSVDIALQHPGSPEDVTVGVLCDMNQFVRAPDPVEWEVFRTGMLERNGWEFHRVWSPAFFRNPAGQVKRIMEKHEKVAAKRPAVKSFQDFTKLPVTSEVNTTPAASEPGEPAAPE